jgi:PEP-CTERM motif
MKTNLTRGWLGGVLLAVAWVQMAHAGPAVVTFDPSAAGLSGAAYLADALTGQEASRISNGPMAPDGSFNWNETGYLQVTGASLHGVPFVPAGLNSTYSMYFAFNIAGFQPNLFSAGYATAMTMNLYGANGVSTFGIDGSDNAYVTNASAPVLLATTSLIGMQTTASIVSFSPLALDLHATLASDFQPVVGGFFVSPTDSFVLEGVFSHPSDGVQVLNGGEAFIITGGSDVLTFAPEPASLALLAAGLIGLAGVRRRVRCCKSGGMPVHQAAPTLT